MQRFSRPLQQPQAERSPSAVSPAACVRILQMGPSGPGQRAAGGSGVGVTTPVCAVTRRTPPVTVVSSAGHGPLLTSRQLGRAAAMEVPVGYELSQTFENPVAMINELKQGVHDLELKVHDLELELLSRDHAQEKFEQQMISQVQSLREQVASLEGAAQVVHDGQAEENRRMGERVEQLERSVSDMRRMSSASARVAEERPAHVPGGEVPSTSGRDERHMQKFVLPVELAECMRHEMLRANCTVKLDNIVKFNQGSSPGHSAEVAIREMNGPACRVSYARWASPRQPGVPPSRLIVTFETPMMAGMVLNMAQWLPPGQAIYPELGPVEAAVASVVRREFGDWRRTAPPAERNCYRMDRAGVRDMGGNFVYFSQAAIDAGMAALQKQRARHAHAPVAGPRVA